MKKILSRIRRYLEKLRYFNRARLINRIRLLIDIKQINIKPRSFPIKVTLSLSNVCNYACPMCSINNLRKSKFKKVINNISLVQLKSFSALFKFVEQLSFVGFVGESVLNPEFIPIVKYLKSRFQMYLFISSNGYGILDDIQDVMVETGFDSVIFSIHAATPETYRILQGSHLEVVLSNVENLQRKKHKKGVSKPYITIVYALNKANIKETTIMIDLAHKLNIERLHLYHYHDYGLSELSLESNVEYANKMLDEIYDYAKQKNIGYLLPKTPPYYEEYSFKESQDEKEIPCYLPWTGLQLRSSYSHSNSLYLGCCNVYNAFLFDYDKHISYYGKVDIIKIWHHPLFQYLRKTVNTNKKHKKNPLCQYCKSKKRNYLKSTDNKKNYEIKLLVLDEFIDGFKANYINEIEEVIGLKVLYTEDDELRALA